MTPDDALDLLLEYPVVILLILDGCEPRLAQPICDAVRAVTDESVFSVMFEIARDRARELLMIN